VKRIDQWDKQCGSKEPVLRGWWPGTVEADDSLMKGRVKAGEKGKWCHRLERLIHLELADLVVSEVYLESNFRVRRGGGGESTATGSLSAGGTPKKVSIGSPGKKRTNAKCVDCKFFYLFTLVQK
jgi:Meiotically up-regulated gene 113